MVTISTADPDLAGTKITVDTRWYAEKDRPLDELFLGHHPIVPRRGNSRSTMEFRLVSTEYDRHTARAYIDLRTADADGGDARFGDVFSEPVA
jgi:hypothetical protein